MTTPVTLGILAHVDAGKTTLCEQLLYRVGVLRAPGRVDHGNTALDADEIERARGITVFSDQAWFELDGRRFTLTDTPGHVDFSAETERSLWALDIVILLIDGASGIQAHTQTLFSLVQRYHKPVLIFLNKRDLSGFDEDRIMAQIAARLTEHAVPIKDGAPDPEQLSLADDGFCERYLSGDADEAAAWAALTRAFLACEAIPVLAGAALSGEGVDELLTALGRLAQLEKSLSAPFDALVCKVRHDSAGNRVTYLKLLNGTLHPRAAFHMGDSVEKIHQLRLYRGSAYTTVDEAVAGELIGVTGLSIPRCGDRLSNDTLVRDTTRFSTTPALSAWVDVPNGTPSALVLEKLRILEDEEPTLSVGWDAEHSAVTVRVMGSVQMEVLCELMRNRFGLSISFLPPKVLYMETIAAPVVGCGHFEPLRHYAEVHLRLCPAPRASGILFESRCHVDDLVLGYQSAIRNHVFEKTHRGVLIGAPICDIKVELLSGRAHLKHTEGGDFREAVYRAIRQGLCKAQSVLLEPFYRFVLTVPSACLGRAMSDVTALFGVYDPPELIGDTVRLCGRGPVSSLMTYPATLRAYTHGHGDIQLLVDGYDLCHNPDEVIAQAAYNPDADTENPASSVFCSHGAGYSVAWNEADALMHLPVETPD